MVDVVVVFADASVLMLSEREADHVLRLLHAKPQADREGSLFFIHLDFACTAMVDGGSLARLVDVKLQVQCPRSDPSQEIPVLALVGAALLNGDSNFLSCEFGRELVTTTLRHLLQHVDHRREVMRAFLEARGMGFRWSRSLLQQVCEQMDLEARFA